NMGFDGAGDVAPLLVEAEAERVARGRPGVEERRQPPGMEPNGDDLYDASGPEGNRSIEQADEERPRQLSLAPAAELAVGRADIEDELDAGVGNNRFVAIVRRVLLFEDPEALDAIPQYRVGRVLVVSHRNPPSGTPDP